MLLSTASEFYTCDMFEDKVPRKDLMLIREKITNKVGKEKNDVLNEYLISVI